MKLLKKEILGFVLCLFFLGNVLMLAGCSGTESEDAALNASAELEPGKAVELTADSAASRAEITGPYYVVRVVDGDTVILEIDGKEERVRLIGVDTPESVHPDKEKNVPYGKIASQYTKDSLEGKAVGLELDVQERDKYGRLLGYIYLDGIMYNKTLLAEGHAKTATYPPNVKYAEEFAEIEKEARNSGKGLWGPYEKAEAENTVNVGYIGNSNSGKFHESGCPSVLTMKEENKVIFDSREDAAAQGYEPCGRCNP